MGVSTVTFFLSSLFSDVFLPFKVASIRWYVILTLAFSWLIQLFIILRGGFNAVSIVWIIALMWVPGIFGLIFRFVKKDWASLPLKLGSLKWWVIIPIFSFFITGLPFLFGWLSGINDFKFADVSNSRWFETGGFWLTVGIMIPSRIAVQAVMAFGEELGWQGYLIPKLIEHKSKKPFLTHAVIWSLWHTPLILFGGYAATSNNFILIYLVSYWVMISSLGMIIGRITWMQKSVWLAALFHGCHNFFIQQWWPMWNVVGNGNSFITGEAGVITAVVFLISAIIIATQTKWIKFSLIK